MMAVFCFYANSFASSAIISLNVGTPSSSLISSCSSWISFILSVLFFFLLNDPNLNFDSGLIVISFRTNVGPPVGCVADSVLLMLKLLLAAVLSLKALLMLLSQYFRRLDGGDCS